MSPSIDILEWCRLASRVGIPGGFEPVEPMHSAANEIERLREENAKLTCEWDELESKYVQAIKDQERLDEECNRLRSVRMEADDAVLKQLQETNHVASELRKSTHLLRQIRERGYSANEHDVNWAIDRNEEALASLEAG